MSAPGNLESARRALTKRLMGRPGVAGAAIGESDGRPCLVVYLDAAQGGRDVPSRFRGYAVVKKETGEIRAL